MKRLIELKDTQIETLRNELVRTIKDLKHSRSLLKEYFKEVHKHNN